MKGNGLAVHVAPNSSMVTGENTRGAILLMLKFWADDQTCNCIVGRGFPKISHRNNFHFEKVEVSPSPQNDLSSQISEFGRTD
jgi:hypothetical protein